MSNKEKRTKDIEVRVPKNLYFDIRNPYQVECMELLNICGRRQAKLLGLMAHEFIINHGINLNNINKDQMKTYIQLLELNPQNSFSSIPPLVEKNKKNNTDSTNVQYSIPSDEEVKKKTEEESFMDKDDIKELDNALSAWGI